MILVCCPRFSHHSILTHGPWIVSFHAVVSFFLSFLFLSRIVWHLYDPQDTPQRIDPPRPRRGFDSDPGSLSVQEHAAGKGTTHVVGQHFWKCA
jgi:hypothetical protein